MEHHSISSSYLAHGVSKSSTAAVITFAHEMQHLVQYEFSHKVYLASDYVKRILTAEDDRFRPWNSPHEHEALLISKKVSEVILGQKIVRRFAEERRVEAEKEQQWNESEKWRFFLDELNAHESFDLLKRTIPLVGQNRDALVEKFPPNDSAEPDFTKANWWD